ncbi:hypothetical protein GF339_03710 [candidate division KSB3 bacterium]|uniref:Glycosyltransferase RgtA/B/C/D-like domain-containing protein n=1 Tax=candidate division KSB3 bacterium TaxID=2044937 RepID=A0A9D5JSX5_9BACT|nr:hypothetical protein [candidate division KSB3 bacterium]MBD3323664.1 hypothetical protein [candidate division KSB3 bacterium]
MMWLLFGLAEVLSLAIGYMLVALTWPDPASENQTIWCQGFLAIGVGLGVSSFTSLGVLVVSGSSHFEGLFITEILLLAILVSLHRFRQQSLQPSLQVPAPHPSSKLLFGLCVLAVSLAVGIFLLRSLENPHGESDAWTFWNLRARLFFRSGEHWRTVFSQGNWSFPTYPQLIPLHVVRVWTYLGRESVAGPIVVALLFTFATLGVMVTGLRLLRGLTQGVLGGILLASTPYFLKHGAAQYADVPLGLYLLATFVLLCLQDRVSPPRYSLLALIGICMGLAAWTKNEGLLFVVSVLLARGGVLLIVRAPRRRYRQEILRFVWGGLPIALLMAYFRIFLAPQHGSASSPEITHLWAMLTDFSRYVVTGKAFLRQLIEPYSLVYSTPIAVLVIYAVLLGLNREHLRNAGVLTSLLALVGMYGGYFLVYITTPHDLTWHLNTSLSRLFLQLWPSTIFVAFMIISTPAERRQQQRWNSKG